MRQVYEALRKQSIYRKLSAYDDDHKLWVTALDLARQIDPEEYHRNQYSKYWVVRLMGPAFTGLELRDIIVSNSTSLRYRLSDNFLQVLSKEGGRAVDILINKELGPEDG